MKLKSNNTFLSQTYGDVGGPFISKGYYLVKQDTLILMHEPLKDPSPSYFEIVRKNDFVKPEVGSTHKIMEDKLYMTLIVVDSKGSPLDQTAVFLMKGEKTYLFN